jgi:WD40 repeat protein
MLALEGSGGDVGSVAFSRDGALIACAAADGAVRVWGARSGKLAALLPQAADADASVLFAPDGRHLLVSSGRFGLALWDVRGRKLARQLVPASRVRVAPGIAFAGDGRLLAARADVERGLWAWDPTTWKDRPALWRPEPGESSNVLAAEPNGTRVALSNRLVLDARTGRQVGHLGGDVVHYWVRAGAFAWAANRPLVALPGSENAIDVADPDRARLVTRLTLPVRQVRAFAFTADGRALVTVSDDGVARSYDTDTWGERQTLDLGAGALRCVAAAAGGRAAAGGSDGKVVVWGLDG